MKLVILLWLIFNVFESAKTEIRHHQQQKTTNVTLPPWMLEDEKKITKIFRDSESYWTADSSRFLRDKEGGEIRGRRNVTIEGSYADNVGFPSSDAFKGTTPLFGPTKVLASSNRAVTTLPAYNDKSVTPPRAESLIAARKISENEECNEKILDNFLVSDHLVTDAIIADRNEAEKLAKILMAADVEHPYQDEKKTGQHRPEECVMAPRTALCLSLANKVLIYKMIIKPFWSYGVQPWGSAANANLDILERFQAKTLRYLVNAPWYVANYLIRQEIRRYTRRYSHRLVARPNRTVAALLTESSGKRRWKRFRPLDVEKRFSNLS